MKLKSVFSILKAAKTVFVYNTSACQWLSDGAAIYPIYDLPQLEPEHVLEMCDVPEDKRDAYRCEAFGEVPYINLDDYDKTEKPLERCSLAIVSRGCELEPLLSSRGAIFFDRSYLRPFSDQDSYDLYERIAEDGRPYIAVKRGVALLGIIMPVDIADNRFVDKIGDILDAARSAMEYRKRWGDYGESYGQIGIERGEGEDTT